MKIRLLAFASAGDALGAGELELELPPGSRVADLRARLDRDFPRLAPHWPQLAVAVDGRLAATDQPLADGCEVALLPPVSGGAPTDLTADPASAAVGTTTRERVELADGPIDAAPVIARVAGPGRGAVVVFLGTVRDRHAGRAVEKLTYAAYRPMALQGLARIVADLEREGENLRVAVAHRLGEVPVGEASVVIAAAAPHRGAAYAASRTALERLKAEIPIWKLEHYAGGEAAWREEEPLGQRSGS